MHPVNMGVGDRGMADTGRAAGMTNARSRIGRSSLIWIKLFDLREQIMALGVATEPR
jgi:hypothetical protein